MNIDELKAQRESLLKAARDIAEKARDEKRDLSADESKTVGDNLAEAKSIHQTLVDAARSKSVLADLDSMAPPEEDRRQDAGIESKSLGEHFVKHAHQRLMDSKGQQGVTISAPEFGLKAASDNHVVGGWTAGAPFLTDFDRTVVQALRVRLTVADLLGQGTISGNAISYLVEGAMEGDFTTVAEAGAKPQIHFVNPTQVTDALKKIAGFIKLTDEFIEDADFLVSEINNRLLYQLGYFEEQQLLNGPGTGSTVLGLLNRSGIQTEASASFATTPTDWPDAIFRSMTKVEVNSGFPADGLVIHPTDYQTFRLQKDANKQYFGGGFFQGQYGIGGVPEKPPLWGLSTVVTPAIAAGTVAVGAFKSVATLYRKGGVRVETATQHASDFTSNLLTVRAEERVALALRVPLGVCKTTLTA